MTTLELFRRFPSTSDLPYASLAALPTPVEPMAALGEELRLPALWVKRDDLSGAVYGGNKVRKLEFILADAVAKNSHRVWTIGAIGSHHALATALYARQMNLEPEILHFPQPLTDHVREVLAALSTTRPHLELIGSKHAIPGAMIKTRIRELLSREDGPYYIPAGGSSPIGVLGYVNAALELARQIDNGEMPMPDAVFVAAGTCGTLAGLILGGKLAELPCPFIGVRVVDKVVANPLVTATLANKAAAILAEYGVNAPKIKVTDIEMIDDQLGSGYGVPTEAGQRALQAARAFGGLELDPTYTAKAFAGLIAQVSSSRRPFKNVLYWHTLSSADLSPLVEKADPRRDLPAEYQEFL